MGTAGHIAPETDWLRVVDAIAATIGRSSPAYRAAVDVSRGFPDAYDRFLMFLEDEPDAKRDAITALLWTRSSAG